MSTEVTIAIADDHQIVVDGLVHMLAGQQEIRVVGTASDGGELIALLKRNPIPCSGKYFHR